MGVGFSGCVTFQFLVHLQPPCWGETQERPWLSKHCCTITKTSLCCQYCVQQKSKPQPLISHWEENKPPQPKHSILCAPGKAKEKRNLLLRDLVLLLPFWGGGSASQATSTGWSLAGSSLHFFPKATLLHSPTGFSCAVCSSFREMTDSAEGTGA